LRIDLNQNNTRVYHSTLSIGYASEMNMSPSMDPKQVEQEIKRKLTSMLVQKLFEDGYIEFTKETNPTDFNRVFRARIVTVDKNVVGELRKNSII
jgi:hypothetical protein